MPLSFFKMASLIQRVADQAIKTFKDRSDVTFQQNLDKLKSLVGQLNAKEVDLNMDSLRNGQAYALRRAPVMYYVDIVGSSKTDMYSMGIFILLDGVRIPLHDHPGMKGIIKVLHGNINVTSYTCVSDKGDSELIAVREDPVSVTAASSPCCLTEDTHNLHEISAVGGPAAFLDILAPPYNNDNRECSYYKEALILHPNRNEPNLRVRLERARPPADYLFGSRKYTGPEVIIPN